MARSRSRTQQRRAAPCREFANSTGRGCRNRRHKVPCEHHRDGQAYAGAQVWWVRRLRGSRKHSSRRLGEALRQAGKAVPKTPAKEAVRLVEVQWQARAAVAAPDTEGEPLLAPETVALLESPQEDNPCASLGWLASLFLLGLDFGIISFGLAELGFADIPEAGVTGDVWVELEQRLAEGGVKLSNQEIAVQLRLLGVHACQRRGRTSSCGCLAEFTAAELHAQITLRLGGSGRRGPVAR